MRSDKQSTGCPGQSQPDALQKMRRFAGAGADFHLGIFFGSKDLDNRDQAWKFPLLAAAKPVSVQSSASKTPRRDAEGAACSKKNLAAV
jgi:hypothetical protein